MQSTVTEARTFSKTFADKQFSSVTDYQKFLLDYRWKAATDSTPPVEEEATHRAHNDHAGTAHDHGHAHGHGLEDTLEQLRQANRAEGLGDFHVMNRFSYLFDNLRSHSLLKRLARRLTQPAPFDPNAFDLAYYESLSEDQKRVRVLLALEKLNHLNHHCFSAAEQRLLRPSNQGAGSKLFNLCASTALLGYFYYAFLRRRHLWRHMLGLGALGLFHYAYLQQLPLRLKEHFRINSALKLAESYYAKHGRSMEVFAHILHPHTSHQVLEHLSL